MSALPTLVLIGPHAAGKSTIGARVAERLGVPFHEEIGRRLREEALARDPSARCALPQPDFDRLVTLRELERDDVAPQPRVVETWHPGNLAYAALRSPSTLPALRVAIGRLGGRPVVVQPLHIDGATLRERFTEPGADDDAVADFLLRAGALASTMARELGLPVLPALDTRRRNVEACVELIAARLEALRRGGGPTSRFSEGVDLSRSGL